MFCASISQPLLYGPAFEMFVLHPITILLTILDLVAASSKSDLLKRYASSSQSASLLRSRGVKQPSSKWLRSEIGQAELYSEYFDRAFITNLTVGGQELLVITDTGSSDTCEYSPCSAVALNSPFGSKPECELIDDRGR